MNSFICSEHPDMCSYINYNLMRNYRQVELRLWQNIEVIGVQKNVYSVHKQINEDESIARSKRDEPTPPYTYTPGDLVGGRIDRSAGANLIVRDTTISFNALSSRRGSAGRTSRCAHGRISRDAPHISRSTLFFLQLKTASVRLILRNMRLQSHFILQTFLLKADDTGLMFNRWHSSKL